MFNVFSACERPAAISFQFTLKNNKNVRSRQDSNLCGETPMDFKSIALTTRPRLPCDIDVKWNDGSYLM